jgi:hypothetical protein
MFWAPTFQLLTVSAPKTKAPSCSDYLIYEASDAKQLFSALNRKTGTFGMSLATKKCTQPPFRLSEQVLNEEYTRCIG